MAYSKVSDKMHHYIPTSIGIKQEEKQVKMSWGNVFSIWVQGGYFIRSTINTLQHLKEKKNPTV